MANLVRLDRVQLEELAELVADALAARLDPRPASSASRLVDARAVAETYGVDRSWVYGHAVELGAVRLGDGPRARLRFDLEEAGRRLASCSGDRTSSVSNLGEKQQSTRRRRRRAGTGVRLLPIRGGERS